MVGEKYLRPKEIISRERKKISFTKTNERRAITVDIRTVSSYLAINIGTFDSFLDGQDRN